LKISFLIYGSVDQVSGGYLYDRKVASRLTKKDDRVTFFSLRQLPYFLSVLQWFSPRISRLLRKGVWFRKDEPADCVVIDELVHPSVWFAALRRGEGGPRFILLVHHLRSRERIAKLPTFFTTVFEKALVNSADTIVVNSRTTASTVEKLLRKTSPIVICPPGSDTFHDGTLHSAQKTLPPETLPKKIESPTNAPIELLAVGNLIRRKGYTLLIHTLSKLHGPKWRLTIAGNDRADPKYTRTLKTHIKKLGLEERVEITGVVSAKRLAYLYHAADIFVFPTQYEGYGICLAEAMSFGLPYVAINSGAVAELTGSAKLPGEGEDGGFRKTEGGFLIDPDDSAALRASLKNLITDANLRKRLGVESSRLASSLSSWRDTGDCFFSAIHGLEEHMRR
jgi:glycosyltransferase involved in cell wall biosynthesis